MKWIYHCLCMVLLICITKPLHGQLIGASGKLKWLRVNALHAYFSEQGAEGETGGTEATNITFSWPGQYGLIQATMRSNAMWLGCCNYYDAKVDKVFDKMVTNVGPKPNEYNERPIFDAIDFRLVGKFDHSAVSVDGEPACNTGYYDILDEINPDLIADRMLVVKNHTSIGATVTKKVYVYTQQDHDNYYIYDYVIKNTGIIDNEGTMNTQTLNGFYFYLLYRYALSGESVWDDASNVMRGWGTNNSSWGRNVVNHVIGTDTDDPEFNDPDSPLYRLRAHYAWYGPHSERPLATLDDDWGCPNEQGDGLMAAAKFVGHSVLHADKSVWDNSDDLRQPVTTHFIDVDSSPAKRANSQYDEPIMEDRYACMSMGHAEKTQAELVEESGLPADAWGPGIGGTGSVQGFGPYTLEPGDSLHIVVAGGVAGLSRWKNMEVGANWLEHYNGTGTPALMMPDGTLTDDHTEYKKAWVVTCEDSILQMFQNARLNFESGYNIPQPPPPSETFTVISDRNRIVLVWADNAAAYPHFGGYGIYRATGRMDTIYTLIFDCDVLNAVHQFVDRDVRPGFDYYYFIVTKDDGSQNDLDPGRLLVSSPYWTMTNRPARLPFVDAVSGTKFPETYSMEQNYPNPFNPETRIRFSLPAPQSVNLVLYDRLGRQVKILVQDAPYAAGVHTVKLRGEDLESGLYLCRIRAGIWSAFRKLIVVK